MGHFRAVAIINTVRTVASWQTVLKVSLESTPGCWLNPRVTQCTLYLSTEPSDRNLCLKRHLLETTLVEKKVMKKLTPVIDKNVKALPGCNFFRTRRKGSLLLFFTPRAKIETKRVWVFNQETSPKSAKNGLHPSPHAHQIKTSHITNEIRMELSRW